MSSTRTALVTGASRGIGRGIAEMLARRGYALTVTARDEKRLSETADALRAAGAPHVETVTGDLADEQHLTRLAQTHRTVYGTLSCLVLNAGVGTAGTVGDLPMKRFDKTFAVNVRAPFVLLQQCLPLLRDAAAVDSVRGARVVALSSITGVHAEAGLAAYGASKAAVNALVETLNAEESGRGVTASAIAPAYVETDMSEWIRESIPAAEMIPVADIVTLVAALLDLSARSVVPILRVTRAGTSGFGA